MPSEDWSWLLAPDGYLLATITTGVFLENTLPVLLLFNLPQYRAEARSSQQSSHATCKTFLTCCVHSPASHTVH
jgi:hypothetical protein